MTDDLVTRLRAAFKTNRPLQAEAADEIDRLRAETANLRIVKRNDDATYEHVVEMYHALATERDGLRAIVTDLAATHPQNGYHCLHCGAAMNNHALPPGTYTHAADCLWTRAREAIGETPA